MRGRPSGTRSGNARIAPGFLGRVAFTITRAVSQEDVAVGRVHEVSPLTVSTSGRTGTPLTSNAASEAHSAGSRKRIGGQGPAGIVYRAEASHSAESG